MSFRNNELHKLLEENDMTFLVKITIHKSVFEALVGKDDNKKIVNQIKYNTFLRDLETRIQLIPMYGGGLNPDLEYEFVIAFRNNDTIKGAWNDSKWNESRVELQLKREVQTK